ncbi:hypothetical protein Theam_0420 [Thermovibrio ammonificans HB-1]|uniref:Uncharacterized protein n=1 Tax=Thermovibrio ammonificans (strain DSM 15698 / JCM 12110 / HB-1) TaxID=648996 RepID=E8T554_THEA1|nr:hypothetical protein [Thermovibrio ammonificans]ADU96392.1 hypothetical protein Theam_0420 [Thermovibrio ammonificans HB-1]
MRKFVALALTAFALASCATTSPKNETANNYLPPPPPQTPLDRKLAGSMPQELPLSAPVNPNSLDKCTRYLLFTDQYISAADYPEAEEELHKAEAYCSPNDPRLNYMRAVLLDNDEKYKEAYHYYYLAAKGYIKEGKLDEAFKCYSGMVSINPNGKEVKELKHYFEDEDY